MLKTPVQFEPAFDRLNEVRPLKLADKAKISLDIPVLDVSSIGQPKGGIGKLLRCNNQGGMLENNGLFVENFELKTISLPDIDRTDYVMFSQKVKGVSVIFVGPGYGGQAFWVAGETYIFSVEIFKTHYVWLPFTGRRMWFNKRSSGDPIVVNAYGFY